MSDVVAPAPRVQYAWLLVPALVGAFVSVALGIYSKEHDPSQEGIFDLFFSATINLKVWFATAAVVLATFQLVTALRMYEVVKWPATVPAWFGLMHRFSGAAAFVLTLPVAYHCLWSIGFQDFENGEVPLIGTSRVEVHSYTGLFFYGAFAAKVTSIEMKGLPWWAIPLFGGLAFAALVLIWYTAAYWFFDQNGFPEF
jgi:Family of unknown function (DUF6529)